MKFKSDIEVQAGLKDSSGAIGTSGQLLSSTATGVSWTSLNGFVPYTGAIQNVDLGIYTLLAAKGVFSSSGSANTVEIGHSSGSGIALNIVKGGNGEALYINKTSGSGNAATIIGTLNATTLVKSGGTAAQFLKADGTVDSTTYVPTSRTITINGVTQNLATNQTWTIPGGVSGSGSIGQVAFWNGTSSITGESTLFWNSTNDRLGIGTANPQSLLHLKQSGNTYSDGLKLEKGSDTNTYSVVVGGDNSLYIGYGLTTSAAPSNLLVLSSNGVLDIKPSVSTNSIKLGNIAAGGGYNMVSLNGTNAEGVYIGIAGGGGVDTNFYYQSGDAGSHIFRTGDGTNYNERMRIFGNGNVFIGASPTDAGYKLDVNGTVRAAESITIGTSGSYTAGSIYSDANWGMIFRAKQASPTNAQFMWADSLDNELMRIKAGNLGIGTTTPTSAKLQVKGYDGTAIGYFFNNTGTAGQVLGVAIEAGTNSSDYALSVANSLGTSYLRVRGDGNVGIGAIDPQLKLHVQGSAITDSAIRIQNTGTGGKAWDIYSTNNSFTQGAGKLLFYRAASDGNSATVTFDDLGQVGIGNTYPNDKLEVSGINNLGIRISTITNLSTDYSVLRYFQGGTERAATYTNLGNYIISVGADGERMRIFSSGNVFIGSSPLDNGARLQVVGDSGYSKGIVIKNSNSSNNNLTVLTLEANQNGFPIIEFKEGANQKWQIYNDWSDDTLNFYKFIGGATNVLTLSPNGNVGIDVQNPIARLQIGTQMNPNANGGIAVSAGAGGSNLLGRDPLTHHNWFPFIDGNNYYSANSHIFRNQDHSIDWMRVYSTGNVAIGPTVTASDAGFRLDVNGTIRSKIATTSAALNSLAFFGIGEFMSTGPSSGYFWENRSGGVTSNSNWYGWYTASGVVNLWNGASNLLSITGTTGATTFISTVTATGFFQSSDERLKDIISRNGDVITYKWKDGRDDKNHVGYSAQEVQKVMPDAVNEDSEGILSVNYIEVLVKKMAEMEKEIAYLKSKL